MNTNHNRTTCGPPAHTTTIANTLIAHTTEARLHQCPQKATHAQEA